MAKREAPTLPQIYQLAKQLREKWQYLSIEDQQEAVRIFSAQLRDENGWPKLYINSETGKIYEPHNDRERTFVYKDTPRYALLKGGEGSGKTTGGVVKTLNRLRRQMSGMLLSPNLPHMKRSTWPEFRRWCPWDMVVESHQRFGKLDWEPHEPFTIVFKNNATLHCAGTEKPGSLEGPNINFAYFDEARHHPDEKVLKVVDGRVRIPGPDGEPPQFWLTTTPAMNWLYTYFGPIEEEDPYESFKRNARVVTLSTKENEPNTFDGFSESRAQSLNEKEARVLLDAEWEDLTEGQPFLTDMIWWDNCREDLPPLGKNDPVVLIMDAATGRVATSSDCFALMAITRHPDPKRRATDVAIRYAKVWQVKPGKNIDYMGEEYLPGPERELLRLCGYVVDGDGVRLVPDLGYNTISVVYDPKELHDMAMRLYKKGIAWFKPFGQGSQRNEADRQLLDLIQQRRIAHDGNVELRNHIKNADRKTDDSGHQLRIVKRTDSLKIDLAVCASMGAYESLRLNLA